MGEKIYIAMNRFQIKKGKERGFEEIWMNRDTQLKNVHGFVEFHLLKGENENEITLYASHTIWKAKKYLISWTKSEEFSIAQKGAVSHNEIYVDYPKFEGFETIL